ncbi:glutathione peroxidase-like isoform X1 [Odontomachus brunneus]|nr:glutathione peroxidase-like isoform X1 [Odontomachus brunneus]XP_032663214.1 glutathione peroxidase-like isoform X1 [Odontomachus brunneus]
MTKSAPKLFDQETNWESAASVYDFHAKDINGNDVPLEKYRGNVLIIVNVASHCGLTDVNYKELEQLYEKYMANGLRILAFPCNQFGNQESGTNKEISEFVQQYNVTFDMYAKIDVNGENAHPLWKWLQNQKGVEGVISWNFTKFLVDRNGKPVEKFSPKSAPSDMEESLKKYLFTKSAPSDIEESMRK